jgi:hypothetical protein
MILIAEDDAHARELFALFPCGPYQRAIFDADARMPLDALADNIASLKLVHWRRCRAPLVKILCPGQFSCPSLTVDSPEALVSGGSCDGMIAAPFIAAS